MKKIISSLLAVMLVMSLTLTAFAADKNDVQSKIDSSIKYAFDGKFAVNGYNAKDSKLLLLHRKSGADVEKFKENYVASVKEALDKGEVTDVVTLAMIIDNLDAYGYDTKNFEGYNLVEKFTSFSANDYYNPFGCYYITETAHRLGLDEFGKSYADSLAKNYYKFGEGTDFWSGFGTSADDLSAFVLGLAPYKEDYKDYIDDALKVLEDYNSEDGYTNFGAASADSTAMALAAYSVVGNAEKADTVYSQLLKYYDETTGGFKSSNSAYMATTNAVLGMEYYYDLINKAEENTPNEDTTVPPTEDNNDKNENKDDTVKDEDTAYTDNSDKSPNTGAVTVGVAASAFALALATTTALRKKKDN